MKKSLIAVPVLAILMIASAVTVGLAGDTPPPPGSEQVASGQADTPETVVFDMHYRAVTTPDDVLSYRSFWGYGGPSTTDSPFVAAVKQQVKESDLVYNAALEGMQFAVVELKDKKPVALYLDLDADGKLSDNEKIAPAASSTSRPGQEFSFITPDFTLRSEAGREIPFRVMLVANLYGGDRLNYMWSPSSILEGQATFAGESMRLLLYGNGFTGSFNTFGRCSFVLVPASQKLEGYLPRAMLSSLICHDGTFYQLSCEGSHEKGKTLQVKIRKDISPTGRMAVSLKGKEPLKTRLQNATITGAKSDTIWFRMESVGSPLPVGQYALSSAYTLYGAESDDEWRVDFSGGPAFTIDKDETVTVALGDLGLSVTSVDERERYRSDVKEKSTYAKGTQIYLSPQIKGKAGEVYMRFSEKGPTNNRWTDIKPHITILDANKKEMASADMEYG